MIRMSQDNSMPVQRKTKLIKSIDALLERIENIRHGDSQLVINLAREAHSLALPTEYWPGVAKSLYYIADSYLRLGNYAAASAPAQQSLIVAETHHLPIDEAYALSALGAVYAYLGEETEALNLFLKQLKIAEQHPHPILTGYALGDIGAVYLHNGDGEKGLDHIRRCYQIFDTQQREDEKYVWFFDVGNFYMQQHDYEKAFTTFEEMNELGQRKNITEAKILGLTGMARARGHLCDYYPAHQFLDQALIIAHQSLSFLDRDVLLARGEVYALQNQPEKAIDQLTSVVELASTTEHWNVLVNAHQSLATLYEKMGNYKVALMHYRAYEEIKAKSFNDRSNSRMQILHTLYEIENVRKEAEIHHLRSLAVEHELNEYKQAEAKRLEVERLKGALDKERELAALKERILTRISHEFRTPLAIIRTSTELLTHYANRLTQEKQQFHHAQIDEQFQWIDKHLRDIGMILRAESPKETIPQEQIHLELLCARAMTDAHAQTHSSERICLEIEPLPDTIGLDSRILLEIMTNMLSNALKFSSGMVSLELTFHDREMNIIVSDTGKGIPQAELDKVFEPLYRGSNVDDIRGNGLGLTIVRDYVSLLGGQTHLTSELNEGTTIAVSIPLPTTPT
jgi:signal transduction histidine kinase